MTASLVMVSLEVEHLGFVGHLSKDPTNHQQAQVYWLLLANEMSQAMQVEYCRAHI